MKKPKCPHGHGTMKYFGTFNRWHCLHKVAGVECDFWVNDEDAHKFH